MHFVAGGAFNGKSAWVKERYSIGQHSSWMWVSAYREDKIPSPDHLSVMPDIVILQGIEVWLRKMLDDVSEVQPAREKWRGILHEWKQWEADERTVIFIGNDITKGIVPIDEMDRKHRDLCGWCFQDTVLASDKADQIWYGIPTKLK
ncbi:bifunctional adenosylcobinamide kinase/adenosylcobinamide-phosphate guanylyltransferase [Falsibacillus albus]|nr:bifunctional adenosylcobinamide kinase/adenosylcobinamide-phosphate guanylyltransferase [Falsibacillus albus]